MGLTKEDLKEMGYEDAEAFGAAFQEGLVGYE
jgi:hypothetical protein